MSISDAGTVAQVPNRDRNGIAISWRIASGTQLQKHHALSGKLCDYLVERTRMRQITNIAVELKSRPSDITSAVEQLQAGAKLLEAANATATFRALLVKSRGIKALELRVLRRASVNFNGKKYPVQVEHSGVNLADW